MGSEMCIRDSPTPVKRPRRTYRIAPPSRAVHAALFRTTLQVSPEHTEMMVILRRDEPDGVLSIVGYSSYRTPFQFFEKDVRVTDAGDVRQRDLRFDAAKGEK